MTKEEIIHQILNEKNTDLYLFWSMKFLKEYPEYKQKIINQWDSRMVDVNIIRIKRNNICSPYTNDSNYNFWYTYSIDLELDGYLNWILRQESYE